MYYYNVHFRNCMLYKESLRTCKYPQCPYVFTFREQTDQNPSSRNSFLFSYIYKYCSVLFDDIKKYNSVFKIIV